MTWSTIAPVVGASFLASAVEVVEAFTIVLAVAVVRGARPAIAGAGLAFLVLGVAVALLGPLIAQVPVHGLQVVIGLLLLVFGLGWLRKAVLRAAGVIPLHDEQQAFAEESAELASAATAGAATADWLGGVAAFKLFPPDKK